MCAYMGTCVGPQKTTSRIGSFFTMWALLIEFSCQACSQEPAEPSQQLCLLIIGLVVVVYTFNPALGRQGQGHPSPGLHIENKNKIPHKTKK